MRIRRFLGALDFLLTFEYLKAVLRLFAYVYALPALVAVLAAEWTYAVIFSAISISTYIVSRGRSASAINKLELREALVVTALAYLLYALIGGLAFLPFASYSNGFFEAMSGITTTGLSVLDVEALPLSLTVFRFFSQWLGGLGVVVLSIFILNTSGKAATKLYSSEGGRENVLGNLLTTTKFIVFLYSLLTVGAFVLFALSGMPWFDAILHALSTLSTGGFSTELSSIASYGSSRLSCVVAVFMLLGSISFPLYLLLKMEGLKRFFADRQLQLLLALLLTFTFLFWLLSSLGFVASFFQVSSALSTTGFAVVDTAMLPEPLVFLTVLLMMTGGSIGSTAGGLKLWRLLLFFKLATWSLQRMLLPEEVKLPIKVNNALVSERQIRMSVAYLVLYVVLALVSIFVFMIEGFALLPALFETISALSTVGLSAGVTSADLSEGSKLLLCFDMWAGRLEIIPVLIVLNPANWQFGKAKQRT